MNPPDLRQSARKQPDRQPPYSPEAEDGILSCIMQAPGDCLDEAVERFGKAEVFYDLRRQTVFDVMVSMREDHEPIDAITLQARLKSISRLEEIGGVEYLLSLDSVAPSPANLSRYLDIVWEKYQLRTFIRACANGLAKAYEHSGPVEALLELIERELGGVKLNGAVASDGRACSDRMVDDLERRYNLKGELSGVDTGFSRLNTMLDGLQVRRANHRGRPPKHGQDRARR